jgi:TolB-like protein/cytochrome c-type biogenesis protein CcmH/NrfG
MGKVRERGIITALATFAGSGWLAYEIVHFILVEHYGLPEKLKDITIMTVLCAMFSGLTWRWFQGEKKRRKPRWERILIPVYIMIAAAVNANYLFHLNGSGRQPAETDVGEIGWKNAIAVLPFLNISADKEQEYFCDGLTEEMITKLSQIPELRVTARTSSFAFKAESWDIREVGQKLGVDKVLEGSVRKDGPRLRITAQLINVADGFHLWSEIYDRDLDKIFTIQDDIASSIAGALKVTLLGGKDTPDETKSIDAYNEFLLGRYYFNNPSQENLSKAVEYYGRAISLDPDYARAWAALAAAQATQAGFGYVPSKEGFEKSLASAEHALALDPLLAYAHAVLGWIKMTYCWDWEGADASFQRALELEPGRSVQHAAQLALVLGRDEQALKLAKQAANLDAMSDSVNATLALTLFYGGYLEDAAGSLRRVLEINRDRANAHAMLGQVLLVQSKPEEALEEIGKERDPYWRLPALAQALHALGRARESEIALTKYIEDYKDVGAFQIAQVYAFRGEADLAFEWLETAYDQRDGGLFLTKADPYLKLLKNDPRYAAFLKKMRLPLDDQRMAARPNIASAISTMRRISLVERLPPAESEAVITSCEPVATWFPAAACVAAVCAPTDCAAASEDTSTTMNGRPKIFAFLLIFALLF